MGAGEIKEHRAVSLQASGFPDLAYSGPRLNSWLDGIAGGVTCNQPSSGRAPFVRIAASRIAHRKLLRRWPPLS